MSNEEAKVESAPKAMPDLSDLEAKRVALDQRIKEAMERKAQEAAEAKEKAAQEVAKQEAAEVASKEASAVEGKNEMESAYTESQQAAQDKEKLTEEVGRVQKELEAFEGSKKFAEENGIPVEDDDTFMQALQGRKDQLTGLDQKRAELDAKMQGLVSNEAVMDKSEEEAQQEDIDRTKQSSEIMDALQAEANIENSKRDAYVDALKKLIEINKERKISYFDVQGETHDALVDSGNKEIKKMWKNSEDAFDEMVSDNIKRVLSFLEKRGIRVPKK